MLNKHNYSQLPRVLKHLVAIRAMDFKPSLAEVKKTQQAMKMKEKSREDRGRVKECKSERKERAGPPKAKIEGGNM